MKMLVYAIVFGGLIILGIIAASNSCDDEKIKVWGYVPEIGAFKRMCGQAEDFSTPSDVKQQREEPHDY